MFAFTLKTALGFFLGILSFCGIIVNLVVVVPVFRLAFVQNKSPIYVISFINIVTDIVNVLMATFYLAPSIIFEVKFMNQWHDLFTAFQSYFFSDEKTGPIPKLMGSIFMFCWYLGSMTQIVMAVNRLVVIYFRRSDLFTRRNICILFCFLIPFSLFLMYMAQYGFPCCSSVISWKLEIILISPDSLSTTSSCLTLTIKLATSTTTPTCSLTSLWTLSAPR